MGMSDSSAAPEAGGPSATQPPSTPPAGSAGPPRGPGVADRGPAAGGLVLGIVLVVAGGLVLVARVLELTFGPHAWPLWIVVPGVALLLGSFAIPSRGGLGMAIPGAILTMVGLVLWVQDTYGLYATWAYVWALVAPTGPGIGMLLYGLVRGDRRLAADGFRTTLVGLALFTGFALFFEGVVGLSGHRIEHLDEVLPYAAIGLGLLLVVLSLLGDGRRRIA
jgi:hypothetical protein